LFVQLANLNEADSTPSESGQAELREAQAAALKLPNTGMAVAIDVGEWNDIHPLNKMAVGERLAAAARHLAYGEAIIYSGPQYRSMTVKRGKVVLSFDHVGSGLTLNRGDQPQGFAVAGEDGNFVWAQAEIRGDQVVVWSDEV